MTSTPPAMDAANETLLALIAPLRERIFAGDNTHCFVERQVVLAQLAGRIDCVPPQDRYATVLEELLSRASTPIAPEDVILGRMVEGPLPEGVEYIHAFGCFNSAGHLTVDWPAFLAYGLGGIARQAEELNGASTDAEAQSFRRNVVRCCEAVTGFAGRYAEAARAQAREAEEPRRSRLLVAAEALEATPAGPAPNFLAALQGMWLLHLVLSCFVGSRDFAFGRMDQYLLPLYEQGLREGSLTRELALALLAHFMLKTKEITGTATDVFRPKPAPCHASNQYVVIGGTSPTGEDQANELSVLVLEAVQIAQVPQPEINVRLSARTPGAFKRAVAAVLPDCGPQVQFWNDDRIIPTLSRFPVAHADRHDYVLTACNRINFPGKSDFHGSDSFHNMVVWLQTALANCADKATCLEDILAAFESECRGAVRACVDQREQGMRGDEHSFHFESALLQDCVRRGRDILRGGHVYPAQYHFLGGVATVANSLLAIRELVFETGRYSLPGLLAIVAGNFEGYEDLRQEIIHELPKYGNDDPEADAMARRVCEIGLDAIDEAARGRDYSVFPSIYTLYQQVPWGLALSATPDGRLAGEPVSENQSPTHGTDREGLTALLKSVSRLPLERTPMAGLNVKLACKPDPEQVVAVVDSFFSMGGVHVGFTFIDRATLLAAQARPQDFRSLCIRVTGFSEYFVALSPEAQMDVIARTEHR